MNTTNADIEYGNIICYLCEYCGDHEQCLDPTARRMEQLPFYPMFGRNAMIGRIVHIYDEDRNKYGKCPGFKKQELKPDIDDVIFAVIGNIAVAIIKFFRLIGCRIRKVIHAKKSKS